MKIWAILPFALALSGCALPMMERTPEYELGYSEGCSSAVTQGPGAPRDPRRNESLYANNDDYRRGWNSGNAQCRPPRPDQF
jgi:hypothetical protein